MIIQEEKKKVYLMLGGTFLPAFTGVILLAAYKKQFKVDGNMLLLFAGLSAIGGALTSKMLE